MSAPSYVPVTNISQIEKIYCNSYNHDVKAPVVYADESCCLYADAEFTKPVDYKLLEDLFFAGVIIVWNQEMIGGMVKPTFFNGSWYLAPVKNGSNYSPRCFAGYNTESERWVMLEE